MAVIEKARMNPLDIRQLQMSRGSHTLFQGLNLSVETGQITVVMGPNGAGKSSLLLALSGMLSVSGEIILQGKLLETFSRQRIAHQIAWQGDLPPTEFGLTVEQRLRLASCGEALAKGDDETKLGETAVCMEIDAFMQRALGELSSGERQRVELAALMLRECPIWLLDEPTSHLDLRHQIVCLNMLHEQAASGRAIVVVLHDIQQAMAIADDVILLDGSGHVDTGKAVNMLTRKRLQSVFKVALDEQSLLPDYRKGFFDENT
ncbi:MAG: ABC transporter ATP-binding protein [Mariprofundaceae bacterium]